MTSDQQFHILHINRQKSLLAKPDGYITRIAQCNALLEQFKNIPDARECNPEILDAFKEWKDTHGKHTPTDTLYKLFGSKESFASDAMQNAALYQLKRVQAKGKLLAEIAKDPIDESGEIEEIFKVMVTRNDPDEEFEKVYALFVQALKIGPADFVIDPALAHFVPSTKDIPECITAIKIAFLEWQDSFNRGCPLIQKWHDNYKSGKITIKDLESMIEESISFQKERVKIVQ